MIEYFNIVIDFIRVYPFTAHIIVFGILLLCGLGLPLPEDIVLIFSGILVALGISNLLISIIVSMCGILIGDSIIYFLGYIYGIKILRFRYIRKLLTANRIKKFRLGFKNKESTILFVARFTPGLRAAIYLLSGITRKVKYRKFILVDFFAAIISVPVWIYIGYLFADNYHILFGLVNKIESVIFTIILIIFIYFIFKIVRKRINGR